MTKTKKFIWCLGLLCLAFNLSSQVEQHEIMVINVSVPVRVFEGERFVNDLTKEDFELYENGILQKIQALYLMKKTQVERREEARDFMPLGARRFYFIFQLSEYDPKLAEAFDHFFQHVIQSQDTLTVMTPVKNYTLSGKSLETKPREELSKELQGLVRKDAQIGSAGYRDLIRDLKRLARGISGSTTKADLEEGQEDASATGLEFLLQNYRTTLEKMEEIRVMDEKKFLNFAAQLSMLEGQKQVFFFYQREFRPELHPTVISRMMSEYQDQPNILGDLQDLMQFYHRYPRIDIERLKQAFANSSLLFNLIFLHRMPENISGVQMTEQSEDVFKTLSQVAKATGGIIESSQNPGAAFKKAVDASESYYLLYYSPENYQKDGLFKNIEAKLKDKDYKIIHRLGYFAR